MENYFSRVIEDRAKQMPDHPAYVFMDRTMTYAQLNESIQRVANSFLQLGLKKGDKIATILPQSPAFVTLYMAASAIGLVVVPLDPRFKPAEMIALSKRTQPKLLVALANPEPIKQTAEALVKEYPFEHVFSYFGALNIENSKPYEALLQAPANPIPDELHPQPDDPLIIIFTSGTTGKPKGAVITQKITYTMAKATVEAWELSADDKVIINLPTSHVGGTHDLLAVQLYAGATGVLMPTFDPKQMLEFIGKYKITYFGGVPTIFRLMFKMVNVEDFDVHSVKLIIVSGEPSQPELIEKIKESFPNANIASSWGMSETAGFFTFTKPSDPLEIVAQTEGAPWKNFGLKIKKTTGEWAQSGEVGELLVKGDSVIRTYMDPEDNSGTFEDGWLKTGDLGYLDENNYLHFVGRLKEMYISGGYNVYPLEIESYLNAHPKINTSCIIEVPDEIFGEVGYAFVVPEEGEILKPEEIARYCEEGLADYKRPKRIIIRKDLPKTLIGKLAKQEIRKNLEKYISE